MSKQKLACSETCPNYKEWKDELPGGTIRTTTNIIQTWTKVEGWVTWDCGIKDCIGKL